MPTNIRRSLSFLLILQAACLTPTGLWAQAPVSMALREAASGTRQMPLPERCHRDPQTGVITDFQTGRQWREGPDRPTSWSAAQAWVESLGAGWRLPTRDELKTLFVKDLPGRKGGACRNMPPEFTLSAKASLIWSDRRDPTSAWQVSLENGGDCWEKGNLGFSHGCRAVAIAAEE